MCAFGSEPGIFLLFAIFSAVVQTSPIANQRPNYNKDESDRIIYPTDLENELRIQSTPTTAREKVGLEAPCTQTGGRGAKVAADLDQGSRVCFEVGTRGPCLDNMKFYAVPENEAFGMCDCDQEVKGLVYSNHSNHSPACLYIYRQEYCDDGDWLEWGAEGLACTQSPCLGNANASLLFNDACATPFQDCHIGDTLGHVGFDASNVVTCLPTDTNYSITRSLPMLKCSKGTRWSAMTNSCRKTMHFKFS